MERFTLLVWERFLSVALPVLAEQSRAVAELGLQNQICNICSHRKNGERCNLTNSANGIGLFQPSEGDLSIAFYCTAILV